MSTSDGLWRVAAWFPAVLVVPAVMVGAVQLSAPDKNFVELRDLIQIDVGTTWVYQVYDHGQPSGTRTRQVTGPSLTAVDTLDSVIVSSHYTDYPGSGPRSDLLYVGVKDGALDQQGFYGQGQHLAIDPPAPAYKLPFEAGASWSHKGTVGANKLRYKTEIEAIEDVEVGGRTFTDCVHFVTVLQWQFSGQKKFGPEEVSEEWTCPGFGPVKLIDISEADGTEVTEELTEFHGATGNWYAEAPDAATGESHLGDTLGFDNQRSNYVDGELGDQLAWSDGRSGRFDHPPVANDEVMVVAERDGEISAMGIASGEIRWRVRLAGPIVAAPTLAGDRVLVSDSRKRLWALSLVDGSTRWVRAFDDVISDAPAVANGVVVVPSEDRLVTALDLSDGSTSWQVKRSSRVTTAPAVDGDQVVVADLAGEVSALALEDGSERWTRSLEGGLLAGPTVADGHVVVGDDSGVIYALSTDDGTVDWEERTVFYPSEQFAVGNGAVVSVGDDEHLEAYDLDDGDERWSTGIPGAAAPVIVGDQAVTVEDGPRVVVRDLADGQPVASWPLPLPTEDATAFVESAPGLVAGSLVFNANITADGHNSTLYAYPVSPEGERAGVSFATETRSTPGSSGGVSVLAGGALFTPGFDQALYRSTGREHSDKLFTSAGLLPGVAAAGDLVLSQNGTDVVAIPATGGDPLWSFASTDSFPGMTPAASDDTAFVPQYGVGLAAVSLADGKQKWATPQDLAVGTTPPLPLPDGDVVYGGGALGRFDGDTGEQEWSVIDGVLFANAAYADGLVFADVVANLSPGGLTALDATTGERVWFHETVNHPLIVGPEAADGVVVFADSLGLVTALEAVSGQELWTLQLPTGIGGHPLILDGRVYLTEHGRQNDLYQRDYRVSVHDLRTGQFLGSFQPPGTTLAQSPVVGAGDGAVLAPAYGADGPMVMILRPQE